MNNNIIIVSKLTNHSIIFNEGEYYDVVIPFRNHQRYLSTSIWLQI